jgi:hypothetical protein
MASVRSSDLPDGALLARYRKNGAYTDCFVAPIERAVSHPEFVSAFYSTKLFRLERWILSWAVSKPSSDEQVEQLATGATSRFAAWEVEDRCENQLLLCDFQGRTRSWLMTQAVGAKGADGTLLFFGSAVVPITNPTSGKSNMGRSYRVLLGFHKLYSVALLFAASRRLRRVKTLPQS